LFGARDLAWTYFLDASDRVRRREDPAPALAEVADALSRCFEISAQDPGCQGVAVQAEWARADWLALRNQPAVPALQVALKKALLSTQQADQDTSNWLVLAETHLRLARALSATPKLGRQHVIEGLAALPKLFAVNPATPWGWLTCGELHLLRAQLETNADRRAAAQEAVTALERTAQLQPLLSARSAPLLSQARALLR
jgi:hypothetical protein